MGLETAVRQFHHNPKRGFRFEAFYESGVKMWQASCQFEVNIELDTQLEPLERAEIEYRQFIRGGVWVRRGNNPWTADDKPNGNSAFNIPPYPGQTKCEGMPKSPVSGTGLSLSWKEDGEVESGGTERFGYRDTASVDAANEKDLWKPFPSSGHIYKLRDTPSIRGKWGNGDSVEVWIELYFRGYVVQVEHDENGKTRPIKVLKKKSWGHYWLGSKLTLWSSATQI